MRWHRSVVWITVSKYYSLAYTVNEDGGDGLMWCVLYNKWHMKGRNLLATCREAQPFPSKTTVIMTKTWWWASVNMKPHDHDNNTDHDNVSWWSTITMMIMMITTIMIIIMITIMITIIRIVVIIMNNHDDMMITDVWQRWGRKDGSNRERNKQQGSQQRAQRWLIGTWEIERLRWRPAVQLTFLSSIINDTHRHLRPTQKKKQKHRLTQFFCVFLS